MPRDEAARAPLRRFGDGVEIERPDWLPRAVARVPTEFDVPCVQARRAGLREELITVHTLRRTAARRFYEASDFDLDETAKALHHSSTATTRVYLNQPERGAREIWESVAALYGL